jgi:hypothetical protein
MSIGEIFDLVGWLGLSGIIAGLLVLVYFYFNFIAPLCKRIKAIFKKLENFSDDWFGEPARKGRGRILGVMERLSNIDGQLQNNGGTSVKDAVDRIEIRVNEIDERLADGDKQFNELFSEIKKIQKDFY